MSKERRPRVAVTGGTGARTELPADLTAFIERVREKTNQPLVMGFGISQAEQVQMVSKLVDGFIVGSALIRTAGSGGAAAAREFVTALR